MGRSWSANLRRPHTAKENVDVLLLLQMFLLPTESFANREFRHGTHSCAARHLCKAGPALQRPDAGTAAALGRLDAAVAAVPADTGAAVEAAVVADVINDVAAQADISGEPWDASDDFDSHAASHDDNPLSSNIALSLCVPSPPCLALPCLNGLQCGGAAAAASSNSRSGSSQPAATGSPRLGPGDEAGVAQDVGGASPPTPVTSAVVIGPARRARCSRP